MSVSLNSALDLKVINREDYGREDHQDGESEAEELQDDFALRGAEHPTLTVYAYLVLVALALRSVLELRVPLALTSSCMALLLLVR